MKLNMKGILKLENQMEEECKLLFKEMFMKESLLMVFSKALEYATGQMEENMKVIGKMEYNMDKEYERTLMGRNMKVIGRKENQMEKECKLTFKEMFMKVNLLMGNLKDMEYIEWQMEKNMKVIG